jgi:serine/threonine protein kinase
VININSTDCLVLEYYSGGTLQELIERNGRIQQPKLYNYCFQIFSAVDYFHKLKIMHRDIKPSNVLLDDYDRIKLADFGLSEHITSNIQANFCRSKRFCPPEIWDQAVHYDPFFADVYSLGVLFYYISQGFLPFNSFSEGNFKISVLQGNEKMDHVDPLFGAMIHKMMNIDPKERPTISQLLCSPIFQNIKHLHSHSLPLISKFRPKIYKRNSYSKIIYLNSCPSILNHEL